MIDLISFIKDNQILTAAIGVGSAGIISFWIKDFPKHIFEFLKRQFTCELIITSQNTIFYDFLKWLEKEYSIKKFRKLKVNNGRWGYNKNAITSIGYGYHWIKYKYWFKFLLITLNKESANQSEFDKETINVLKLGRNNKIFSDIIEKATNVKKDETKVEIYKMEDNWIYTKELIKRSFESIFMENKKQTLLLETLDKFINNETWYLNHGIPYQLGILLYGSPGTGKTSIIKAIASYLNYPIYYIPTSKLSKVELALSTLPSKCLLVIEDIDCNSIVQDREKTNDNDVLGMFSAISLSEILNSLDGMFFAHGRILIATTNHIEILDDALIRPGRIDVKIEIGYVNLEIFYQFLKSFFPDELLHVIKPIKPNLTTAMLQGYILEGKNKDEIIKLVEDIV